MRSEDFQIAIGQPHAGWLPLTISLAGEVYEYDASNVLNDPLAELAEAAASLVGAGPVRESIEIWLEPAYVHLQFEGFVGADAVEVSLFDIDERVRFASAVVPRAAALSQLVDALGALQAQVPRSGMLEEWGASFPTADLRRAKAGQTAAERSAGFPSPWRPIEDIERIRDEIRIELGRRHELSGVSFRLRAFNEETDEYLVELASGADQFAVVSLDWSGKRQDPMPVALFKTLGAWQAVARARSAEAGEASARHGDDVGEDGSR